MLLDSWGIGYGPPPRGNSVLCSLFHDGWTFRLDWSNVSAEIAVMKAGIE